MLASGFATYCFEITKRLNYQTNLWYVVIFTYTHDPFQVASLMDDETVVWMASSEISTFLIEEFERENEETQSASPHVINPRPTEEPPNKVQKQNNVAQER